MRKKMYWGIALLAFMTVTVSCGSDDDESFEPSPYDPKCIKLTEEMLTGFEYMGLLGEWTLQASKFEMAPKFTEPVKIFFYSSGMAMVEVPEDFGYFLEPGMYSYTVERRHRSYDSLGFTLKKGNQEYTGGMGLNYLRIDKPKSADFKMSYLCEYARERTAENEIPYFFYDLVQNLNWLDGARNEEIHAVNDMEELRVLIHNDCVLPQIDFNRYTLVMGWYFDFDKLLVLDKLEIENRTGGYDFKMCISSQRHSGCGSSGLEGYVFFWRLLPKFEGGDVTLQMEETLSELSYFVESTSYTEEMLTGFEPLGIQGEWEMLPWNGIRGEPL